MILNLEYEMKRSREKLSNFFYWVMIWVETWETRLDCFIFNIDSLARGLEDLGIFHNDTLFHTV